MSPPLRRATPMCTRHQRGRGTPPPRGRRDSRFRIPRCRGGHRAPVSPIDHILDLYRTLQSAEKRLPARGSTGGNDRHGAEAAQNPVAALNVRQAGWDFARKPRLCRPQHERASALCGAGLSRQRAGKRRRRPSMREPFGEHDAEPAGPRERIDRGAGVLRKCVLRVGQGRLDAAKEPCTVRVCRFLVQLSGSAAQARVDDTDCVFAGTDHFAETVQIILLAPIAFGVRWPWRCTQCRHCEERWRRAQHAVA